MTLDTSVHSDGVTYELTVTNVEDLFANAIAATPVLYTVFLSDPTLRGHWKLDDGTGAVALDATPNGNDGAQVGGPVGETGQVAGALRFDGVDDRVEVPSAPLGVGTWAGFTVAAWVKNDIGVGAGVQDIASWWSWNGFPCSDCSFVLTHHKNDQYFFEMPGANVSGGAVSTEWTHVVGTYDGAFLRLYVNGSEVGSAPRTGPIAPSSAQFIIGGQGDQANYFDGLIDDVRLYERALSSSEILDIFNETSHPPDTTAPTNPSGLTAPLIDSSRVDLSWTAASDPESGVDHYDVFRDGVKIGESTAPSYSDTTVSPLASYTYEVSATNGALLESGRSTGLVVNTPSDSQAPGLTSVLALSDSTVEVLFDEDVDPVSAETAINYAIDQGVLVTGASLAADGRTVALTTTAHADGLTYELTVTGVQDFTGNVMPPTPMSYLVDLTDPTLRGHWTLDDGTGAAAPDVSGNGNDGAQVGGPVGDTGMIAGALHFDGVDGRVEVPSAPLGMGSWPGFTVSAWVKNDVGAGAGVQDIATWWNWNGYPCTNCSFVLTHHGNDQYFFEISGANVSGGAVSTAWTHVAGTYDGALLRLYVNGTLVGSTPRTGPLPSSTGDFVIGGQADDSNYFDGMIDDVQLYERALSDQEISDLANL